MQRFIISFEHGGRRYFAHWSTVVDAPVSRAMGREEFQLEYLFNYGYLSEGEMLERMERAERTGSSSLVDGEEGGLHRTVWLNRAGPGERCLTLPGLIAQMLGEPVRAEHVMREGFAGDDDHDPFNEWLRASYIGKEQTR